MLPRPNTYNANFVPLKKNVVVLNMSTNFNESSNVISRDVMFPSAIHGLLNHFK